MADAVFSAVLAITGPSLVGYALATAAVVGVSVGIAELTTPDVSDPAAKRFPLKQSRPARVTGTGRDRLAGCYLLFEGEGEVSWDVLAIHDGRIDGIEHHMLEEDIVTLDGSNYVNAVGARYSNERVQLDWRYGASTETNYAALTAARPTSWPSNARGDGIATVYMKCDAGVLEHFAARFPSGLPRYSQISRLSRVYDPRNPLHDVDDNPADPATWTWSANPVLGLLFYMCFAEGGPGIDYSRYVLPAIESWKTAADVCDEEVLVAGGGPVARYSHGGSWSWDTAPSAVIDRYRQTFDGWLSRDGRGCLVLEAGRYTLPTTILEADDIRGYRLEIFQPDEEAINELQISYVSPDHNYNEVQTDAWRDEALISAMGRVRSTPLDLIWVHNNSQARRLGKREYLRKTAARRGTLYTPMFRKAVRGQRYLRLRGGPHRPAGLADIVVEVLRVEFDLMDGMYIIDWIEANPLMDAWDPDTEEGDGPGDATGGTAPDLTPPEVTEIVVETEVVGETDVHRIVCRTPDEGRTGLVWQVQRRTVGELSWTLLDAVVTDEGSTLKLVPAGGILADTEVQFRYVIDATGAASPWVPPTPEILVVP